MSHGSHEPYVDESRLEQAGPWYQCLSSKQTLFALGQHAGPPCLRGSRCGVQNSVAELWNVPRAHLATGQAQDVPIYRPGAKGGSIMGNNEKIGLLLHILTCYTAWRPVFGEVYNR